MRPPKGMKECPQCDPCSPELDSDGMPYTCYRCCDSGWVPIDDNADDGDDQQSTTTKGN